MIAEAKAGSLSLTRIDSSNPARSESPERGRTGAGAVAHPNKKIQQNSEPKYVKTNLFFILFIWLLFNCWLNVWYIEILFTKEILQICSKFKPYYIRLPMSVNLPISENKKYLRYVTRNSIEALTLQTGLTPNHLKDSRQVNLHSRILTAIAVIDRSSSL